ncbi:MAG: 30S ribosomal protein S12 methylthiotransferase RimO [Chitinispirillia bacterium]|nr:30S ribosomal protein S12 methylthiotransferase RimO [Chitinispirillia bacterium]MCL2241156.1 30S ribosomal protein S12 methylthiotransferase RimO [Chitinispirillia bacterium]
MSGKKTAAIQNLGCSKNQIDGERILALFASNGFEITEDASAAGIIIVNTCAFIKEAQEEAVETVLEMAELRKKGQCKTLIVSGCFSQRYRDFVKEQLPEVDVWAGVDDWENLLSGLAENFSAKNKDAHESPQSMPINGISQPKKSFKRILSEPLSTQYLKIAEGCSHKCSFCVIPSIRGNFRSRGIDDIMQEAKWLYGQGTRELILVAQDTSFYGRDIGTNLVRLLESLLKGTAFPWIRMMYLHPQLVSDDLLKLIASESRLCRYFDIPLQHINDNILTAMNRQPLSGGINAMIDRIRKYADGATIRTSFIAGFPGETEKEFGELTRFIQAVRFDKLGVFPFSPEEGTPAYAMPGRPRANTVQRRCEELMSAQQEISREILESKVGSQTEIIIDRISDDPDFNYEGRTKGDAPEVDGRVFIRSGSYETGQILPARIIGASDYDLYAE